MLHKRAHLSGQQQILFCLTFNLKLVLKSFNYTEGALKTDISLPNDFEHFEKLYITYSNLLC